MRKFQLRVFIAALAAAPGYAAAAEPAQHLLEAINESSGAPGVSAAVAHNGVVVWSGHAGMMRRELPLPVTAETQFRIASVSKLFAATLALALAEEGVIDLDADIRRYIPEWTAHGGAVITVRQLAAHIAGLAHYGSADHPPTPQAYTSLSDALGVYAHKPLLFAPGDDYEYSSYGYALMGAVLERASGKSFATLLEELVTAPLELERTVIEDPSNLPPNASALFSPGASRVTRADQRHVVGASALLSTPTDLVTFADAYATGAIISPETVEMSWAPTRLNNGAPVDAGRFRVGFGWRLSENWEGEPVAHHAGTTPGARSILSYNRRRNSAAAFLSNAQWVSRMEETVELIAAAAIEGDALDADNCPVGEWRADGEFSIAAGDRLSAKPSGGVLSVSLADGVCEALLTPEGAMMQWLSDVNASQSAIRLILIAQRNNDLIFAAATPWGAFALSWADRRDAPFLSGDFAGRDIDLRLTSAPRQ